MDVELSEEQQLILEKVKENHNVMVDACAGTGKTTIILAIAKHLSERKFLELTYNSMLRHEVKEKVKKQGINNVTVHTFHSLAVKYYYPTAYTDTGLRYILYHRLKPQRPIDIFDVLVLDETQDMTLVYFQFMCKVVMDMGSPIQLLIMGDYMQGLYEFKGSDTRFLTLANKIWENHPCLARPHFETCTMRMSYRITNQMCQFINTVMLGESRMRACRDGPPVIYACQSRSNLERIVFSEITKLLDGGALPSDIFVLGASVNGINSNIRRLENALVERGIPCHVPMMEKDKIDERVIQGKVVFSSFHSIKGRERKYVFIVNFDNSYMKYYARNLPSDKCPSTLYVGTTRATERLYLLETNQFPTDRPLDFLKLGHAEMATQPYIQFRGNPRTVFFESTEDSAKATSLLQRHNTTPTDLIKFINESILEEISPIVDRIFVEEVAEGEVLDIPSLLCTKSGFYEEVSDLNGIAIPAMYYDYVNSMWARDTSVCQKSILKIMIENNIDRFKANEHGFLKALVEDLPDTITTIRDYLYYANIHVAIQETLYFKIKQINADEYEWLDETIVYQCKERLRNIIGVECEFAPPLIEETILHQSEDAKHKNIDVFTAQFFDAHIKFRFTARTDMITEKTVWELKCTSKISLDHILQTVIYAWLWRTLHPGDARDFKILNIKTGEIRKLEAKKEELDSIMVALLKGKYQEISPKTEEEFVEECRGSLQDICAVGNLR
jgi:hypothetical protein